MQTAVPSPELKTIQSLNITHELANPSQQQWEAFVTRDLKDKISFRLEIQDTSIT